jgi:hypothetical protein
VPVSQTAKISLKHRRAGACPYRIVQQKLLSL